MSDEQTTTVVQSYLDELRGDSPAEPIVRALLDRAVRRLHLLCPTQLNRSYPRLARPPLNLHADECEVFDLVGTQGVTQAEVAQLLGVSAVTVKRRLSRGLSLLAEQLADLRPGEEPPGSI